MFIFRTTGKIYGLGGFAVVPDSKKPNQLLVKFPNSPVGRYNVWNTDYVTYSLVYSCNQIGPAKYENMWVLSRKTSLSTAIVQKLRNTLKNAKVNITTLLPIPQNCR